VDLGSRGDGHGHLACAFYLREGGGCFIFNLQFGAFLFRGRAVKIIFHSVAGFAVVHGAELQLCQLATSVKCTRASAPRRCLFIYMLVPGALREFICPSEIVT
jgi:hypothetical protein